MNQGTLQFQSPYGDQCSMNVVSRTIPFDPEQPHRYAALKNVQFLSTHPIEWDQH